MSYIAYRIKYANFHSVDQLYTLSPIYVLVTSFMGMVLEGGEVGKLDAGNGRSVEQNAWERGGPKGCFMFIGAFVLDLLSDLVHIFQKVLQKYHPLCLPENIKIMKYYVSQDWMYSVYTYTNTNSELASRIILTDVLKGAVSQRFGVISKTK